MHKDRCDSSEKKKGVRLTDHILHLLQRYSSKPHIAISVKSFNGSFGAYEIHYPISWGHPCNAMILWQKKKMGYEYIVLILSRLDFSETSCSKSRRR